MNGFEIFEHASDLPPLWDDLAENSFQQKAFLKFLEEVNPCKQRYHLHRERRILLISYRLKLNLLTFVGLTITKKITIVGIPLSVASAGYVCPEEERAFLAEYLQKFPLTLVLNSDGNLPLPRGMTLPNFVTQLNSLEEHINAMRSHYRYRIKKALKKSMRLRFETLPNELFDEDLYRYYEEVYERSEGKLEKLSLEFFRRSDANLVQILSEDGEKLGFFLTREEQGELLFLFCGFSHRNNLEYDLYMNILLKILEHGQGYKKIHLGQTTAYSKMRVGATEEDLYLHLASCWVPKWILQKLAKLLSYKDDRTRIHCMKK